MPFLAYTSLKQDVLSPAETTNLCDNINTNIQDAYIKRQDVQMSYRKMIC